MSRNLNQTKMKTLKSLAVCALFAGATTLAVVGCKTDGHHDADSQVSSGSSSSKSYPFNKCLVTDEAFENGKTYTFVRNGQEIKLCCKDCLADFNKDPDKYLAKLNAPK
jgi:hypothetical protein